MICKYGTSPAFRYTHVAGEVGLTVQPQTVFTERNERLGIKWTYVLNGRLLAANVSALTTAIDALEAAYGADGYDWCMYDTDGTTPTSHFLDSSEAMGGVKVVSLSYPATPRPQYVNMRDYQITLEATFHDDSPPSILAWTEAISYEGGGPVYRMLPNITGKSTRQQVNEEMHYRLSQRGMAVGRIAYPNVAAPLFAGAQARPVIITKDLPDYMGPSGGLQLQNYTISWDYLFESTDNLAADPTFA